jgi:hypothetical protein
MLTLTENDIIPYRTMYPYNSFLVLEHTVLIVLVKIEIDQLLL